ncbi:MAG: hypothetical protein HKN87_10625 [Saprospiraceae bacterium]|nr:hypothetical protein [Saprospiraceae bacterium]
MTRFLWVFLMLMICINSEVHAQATEQMLRTQLLERGIPEELFLEKLQDRGVTYGSLEEVPPEQYDEIQSIVEEILAEIELEKANTSATEDLTATAPAAIVTDTERETIQEAKETVIEGATVEEAVEEAKDEQEPDLPAAKIYGHQIFRNQSLTVYRQADEIKPKPGYILGAGDELTVSIWGVSIFERTYTIDNNGYINPSAMPRVYLKDLTFAEAKDKLRRHFANFNQFSPDQFEVSLRFARTISVGIYGEVFKPGNHTISAINSAFNALVAAGGPTDIGTIRNIRWIKSDGSTQQIDVYQYMSDPTIIESFYMQENDIIQVPLAEKIVDIQGAINRPMSYELIDGEHLHQLVAYAGGLKVNAYRQLIQLKRFENDEQIIIDIPYSDLLRKDEDFQLQNGDQISIKNIPTSYRNFVTIAGTVELPGQYEFVPNMRISDLVDKASLKEETSRAFAVLRRTNRDGTADFERIDLGAVLEDPTTSSNVLLQPNDQLTLYAKGTFIDQYVLRVEGQVRNPGPIPYDPSENMRIRDAILMAGGLTPGATDFAYVIRQDLETGQPTYISLDIQQVMVDPSSNDNLVIRPGDQIKIQAKKAFIDNATLTIDGAVRAPGTFRYDTSMALKDLITLANGLKMQAATNRIDVSRMVIRQNEATKVVIATLEIDESFQPVNNPSFVLQPYDQVYVRMVPEFEFQKTVYLSGEVRYPGPYALISDNERISSIIQRAGGMTREAFPEGATLTRPTSGVGPIVIELDRAIENDQSNANIILKDQDQIIIPKIRDFVAINGAVNTTELYRQDLLGPNNRVTVVYDGNRSARYYIEKYAGGFGDNSDRRKVTVEYPNGQIKKAKDFGLFRVYPKVDKGSIVKVGIKDPKQERVPTEKEEVDWGEVLSNAVAQATAVLTLILLIDRAGR